VCCVSGAEVRRQFSIEEEDELLQFAIQQSLIEAGSEKDEVLLKYILDCVNIIFSKKILHIFQ
jgi:hypothetical protein